MDDPLARIRSEPDDAEALRLALEEIRAAVWEPGTTLPNVKRRVAKVLAAARAREES